MLNAFLHPRTFLRRIRNRIRVYNASVAMSCRDGHWQAVRQFRSWRICFSRPYRKPITLFLAPEAGLGPFFSAHLILARALADHGRNVVLLSCRGMQPICNVKFAISSPPTAPGDINNPACKLCRTTSLKASYDYKLPDLSLESLLSWRDLDHIRSLLSVHSETPWKLAFDNIEFGSAALGEILRDRRKSSLEQLDEDDKTRLNAVLYSSLAIYFAVEKLALKFKINQIAYFGDYAFFLPPQIFAARRGIDLINVSHAYNGDIDVRHILIRRRYAMKDMLDQVERWDTYRDVPLSPKIIAAVNAGGLYRLTGHGGASTYSPNLKNLSSALAAELGLDPNKQVLAVFPSSMDEVVCAREFTRILGFTPEPVAQPFLDQRHWLKALLEWAETKSDVQLVIRLHPRVGSTHRQAGVSNQMAQLQEDLAIVPSNVFVIWPESTVSSYNVIELSDAILIAWTSLGLEAARFGVPVVAAFQQISPFPVGGFIAFGETRDAYFRSVTDALAERGSFSHITEALRWTYFLHWSHLIDVSDVVPSANFHDIPLRKTPKSSALINSVLTKRLNLETFNMAQLPRHQSALDEEADAVIKVCENIINVFLFAHPLPETAAIGRRFYAKNERTLVRDSRNDRLSIEVLDRSTVILSRDGTTERRRSPLIARLSLLLLSLAPARVASQDDEPLRDLSSPFTVH